MGETSMGRNVRGAKRLVLTPHAGLSCQTWHLCVEEHFFKLFPPIVTAIWWRFGRSRINLPLPLMGYRPPGYRPPIQTNKSPIAECPLL